MNAFQHFTRPIILPGTSAAQKYLAVLEHPTIEKLVGGSVSFTRDVIVKQYLITPSFGSPICLRHQWNFEVRVLFLKLSVLIQLIKKCLSVLQWSPRQ
jgi:hypothetical protein